MSGETPTVWKPRPFCLRCALCCRETEMVLTPTDVEKLVSLGYRVEYFAVEKDGLLRLRNVDGRCVFLKGGRCTVYEFRPIGCSLYPIVIDADSGEVVVDDLCPLASTTTREELRTAKLFAKLILEELGIRAV